MSGKYASFSLVYAYHGDVIIRPNGHEVARNVVAALGDLLGTRPRVRGPRTAHCPK
jgi:hypothetical protein